MSKITHLNGDTVEWISVLDDAEDLTDCDLGAWEPMETRQDLTSAINGATERALHVLGLV